MLRLSLVALILSVLSASAQTPDAPSLAVKRVVLYKHGIGYFEREGTVDGDGRITLGFTAAQMRDVLKSLYAVDVSGGRIESISYDTKDPLSKQLEDIHIEVPAGAALTHFLSKLKGARVEISAQGATHTGSILGIEPIRTESTRGTATAYRLVLLSDGGRITPVDLLSARYIKLLDPELRADLDRMLSVLLRAKHADRKSVVLEARGEGQRTVRAGYIIETPIWKTSYRVLFDEENPPLLQGWAILENTTDEDWKDVDVSFVAGSPVSFIMDLYTAYYPARQEIAVGIGTAPTPEHGPPPAAPAPSAAFGAWAEEEMGQGGPDQALRKLQKSFEPATEGVTVGELFAYHAKDPVSVRRGQAALVPIVAERTTGSERILHYRPGLDAYPMNAWRVVNGTSLTLESGPITFFDGATCIGESFLPSVLKPGMDAILDYAVEAGVFVRRTTDREQEPVTRATIADGVMTLVRTENLLSRYTLDSSLPTARVLYLDHQKTEGFTLDEPKKADDDKDGRWRFRLELPPRQTLDFTVKETRPVSTRMVLLQTPLETIRASLSATYLSDGARALLQQMASIQARIAEAAQKETDAQKELERLVQDQERFRQNLKVLRENPKELELRARYLKRLEGVDREVDTLRATIDSTRTERQGLEAELRRVVNAFRED
jgi:hypothetical protein